MEEILEAASRASTVGNMQLYSIIVTTSRELLEQLAPLHFNQPAATTAPVLLTFCADIHRFSRWCELRGAEPGYDNFCWFMNGVTDALLASQNACRPKRMGSASAIWERHSTMREKSPGYSGSRRVFCR